MAGIEDVLRAAQAKKSPLVSLLEGAVQGFGQGLNQAPEMARQKMAFQQEQEDRERRAQMDATLRKVIAQSSEDSTQASLAEGAGGKPRAADRKLRLKGATLGKGGYLEPDLKVEDEAKPKALAPKEYMDEKGRTRIGSYDAQSGKVIQSPNDAFAPAAAGQGAGEKQANLRKEFLALDEVKDFITSNTSVRSMDALLSKAILGDSKNQAALDQGLITMYNKLTDPQSVVRESEYARTPENLPMVNRMIGAMEKLAQGGAGLTNDDRQALVLGAKIIANERGAVYSDRRAKYSKLAESEGFPAEKITGTVDDFVPFELGATKTQGPTPIVLPGAGGTRLAELRAKKANGSLKGGK